MLLYDWEHGYPWSKAAKGAGSDRITRCVGPCCPAFLCPLLLLRRPGSAWDCTTWPPAGAALAASALKWPLVLHFGLRPAAGLRRSGRPAQMGCWAALPAAGRPRPAAAVESVRATARQGKGQGWRILHM